MIYDTLFALDDKLEAAAADGRQAGRSSDDKLTWTFTLRDGLKWHDGTPVTVGRLHRLDQALGATRDAMGQKLLEFVAELKAVDDKTFTHRAQGAVRPGADSARQAVVERAVHHAQAGRRDRSDHSRSPTRPARARSSSRRTNGSPARRSSTSRTPSTSRAPSRRRAWPAARSPRSTASNGSSIPDAQTAINALIAGEIDMIEQPPHDLLPLLEKDKNVEIVDARPARAASSSCA